MRSRTQRARCPVPPVSSQSRSHLLKQRGAVGTDDLGGATPDGARLTLPGGWEHEGTRVPQPFRGRVCGDRLALERQAHTQLDQARGWKPVSRGNGASAPGTAPARGRHPRCGPCAGWPASSRSPTMSSGWWAPASSPTTRPSRALGLTRARVSQLQSLVLLAPDIQEASSPGSYT